METMQKLWCILAAAAAILAISALGQEDKAPAGKALDEKIARGKYLVEEVAKCQDCHTPKMDNGSYIKSSWMKGATMNLAPAIPVAGWHAAAPDVTANSAIWKRWGEDGMINFFVTGKTPRGSNAGAPMPAYTLKREDAEAIVAFLKSLQ
jgi:mono/diheme cytochrome c family protein